MTMTQGLCQSVDHRIVLGTMLLALFHPHTAQASSIHDCLRTLRQKLRRNLDTCLLVDSLVHFAKSTLAKPLSQLKTAGAQDETMST